VADAAVDRPLTCGEAHNSGFRIVVLAGVSFRRQWIRVALSSKSMVDLIGEVGVTAFDICTG
jgi:hypothetical protein